MYFYHLTDIKNLENILDYNLLPKKDLIEKNIKFHSRELSKNKIIRENKKIITNKDNEKTLNEAIPFYLAKKTPYQYSLKTEENQFLIFVLNFDKINNLEYAITNANAVCDDTKIFYNISEINKKDIILYESPSWYYFPNGSKRKMAEILIFNDLKLRFFEKIVVNSRLNYEKVFAILNKFYLYFPVEINSSYFFNDLNDDEYSRREFYFSGSLINGV